jgi:deoxyribose-phosphate aldolase
VAAGALTFVDRIAGAVDAVGAEERAAMLATRSIKRDSKLWALDLAVRCCDLTTLEGADSPGKVRQLAAKALRPAPADPAVPHVAALCVYPRLVPVAVASLRSRGAGSAGPQDIRGAGSAGPQDTRGAGSAGPQDIDGVKVASVGTGFPAGQTSLELRLAEVSQAVADGADEIDMVISRGAWLAGESSAVTEEVARAKEACGSAHLKVILETGELGSYDAVRRAALVAMSAGADWVKTSTGKTSPAATLPVAVVMGEAIRDYTEATGRAVGLKVAGGVRTAKDAIRFLVVVHETLGDEWLTPERFRIGASSLLNDLLMQRDKQLTGVYSDPDRYTLD